ncbi:MAG TPA: hypothetical protein VFZ21_02165 [Gemmatimonadaceae bacterium]|nr:hypothetical protein [Gemmatimonadaceae bacterium]
MPIDTDLLARSCATPRFKTDVLAFASRADVASITLSRAVPRIKVIRLINQLLHAHPEFAIERLHIDARSGCSDFVGTVVVEGAGESRLFEFAWDCRWRAEQQGWVDAFGFPDQIRAADEFGWNCFQRWQERSPTPAT